MTVNPLVFGRIMIFTVLAGYIPATICFYYGGKRYA
jgi:hypothetical protein